MLSIRLGKKELISDNLSKCINVLPPEFKLMINFPYEGSVEDASEYLAQNKVSTKETLRILSIWRIKKQIIEEKKNIFEIIELFKNDEHLASPQKRQKVLAKISAIKTDFWRNFFEFSLASRAKNMPWAQRLKLDLMKYSPYWTLIKGVQYSQTEERELEKFFIQEINNFSSLVDSGEQIKILAHRLNQMGLGDSFENLSDEFDSDWSLTDLRERVKNPLLRTEFFDFWYLVLMNRTSEAELKEKMRGMITIKTLYGMEDGQLWPFEYTFSGVEKKREIIIKRLNKMWNSKEPIDQYTVLRVSQNPVVKKLLSEINSNFQRANFQIKREFFKDVLYSGYSTDVAMYELILLGDKDNNHLWWVFL